jgi:hypothetical protein
MLVPSSKGSASNPTDVKEQDFELISQTIGVSDPCPLPEHRHAEQQEGNPEHHRARKQCAVVLPRRARTRLAQRASPSATAAL